MKSFRISMVLVCVAVLASTALAQQGSSATTPPEPTFKLPPFSSTKGLPWHQGFAPVQKTINANAYGSGLEKVFAYFAYLEPKLSFRVDNAVLRREWEPMSTADGQTAWTSRTRFVYCFVNRPLWEFMDHVAKVLDGYWWVENDVCVLLPNPMQSESPLPGGRTAPPPPSPEPALLACLNPQTGASAMPPSAFKTLSSSKFLSLLTEKQMATHRLRGYLKTTELTAPQKRELADWLKGVKVGEVGVVYPGPAGIKVKRLA